MATPTMLDRRRFLSLTGAAAAAAAAGPALAACGSDASRGAGPVRIGWVSPETGSLSAFAEADQYVAEAARSHFRANPLVIAGTPHGVDVVKVDSLSSPTRATDVAGDLIQNGGIDLMLVSGTADTTNPVSDACEVLGMPCIATTVPWQPWFVGRGGTPDKPFTWSFQFFFGLEDLAGTYLNLWDSLPTNKVVGSLWSADSDGFTWGNPDTGMPSYLVKRGYRQVDAGTFPPGTRDFGRYIAAFRKADVDIVVGVMNPDDFDTFWEQAGAQRFRPKVVTVAEANPFPATLDALGPRGVGLCTDVWWSPDHPFTSSVTGQTARQLCDAYTSATGKQWIMPIGFGHALVEVAAKALRSVSDPTDRAAVAAAIRTMRLDTVVGPLDWTKGPVPGAASAPMVGGQWRATNGGPFPYDLVIVNNQSHPNIPAAGTATLL